MINKAGIHDDSGTMSAEEIEDLELAEQMALEIMMAEMDEAEDENNRTAMDVEEGTDEAVEMGQDGERGEGDLTFEEKKIASARAMTAGLAESPADEDGGERGRGHGKEQEEEEKPEPQQPSMMAGLLEDPNEEATADNENDPQPEEEGKEENGYAQVTCNICRLGEHDEDILLCDICDGAYHTYCLVPALYEIPQGDWFCQPCQMLLRTAGVVVDGVDGSQGRDPSATDTAGLKKIVQLAQMQKSTKSKRKRRGPRREDCVCPHCNQVCKGPAALGAHQASKHGVHGSARGDGAPDGVTVDDGLSRLRNQSSSLRMSRSTSSRTNTSTSSAPSIPPIQGVGEGVTTAPWTSYTANPFAVPGEQELVEHYPLCTSLSVPGREGEMQFFQEAFKKASHYQDPSGLLSSSSRADISLPSALTTNVCQATPTSYDSWAQQFPSSSGPEGTLRAPSTGVVLVEHAFSQRLGLGVPPQGDSTDSTRAQGAESTENMGGPSQNQLHLSALTGKARLKSSTKDGGDDACTISFAGDVLINAGGPVTCTAFAPPSSSCFASSVYLAVGLARLEDVHLDLGYDCANSTGWGADDVTAERVRVVGETIDNPSVIQIWRAPLLGDSDTVCDPKLEFCIGLPVMGAVVALTWSPFPLAPAHRGAFLGLLAVLGSSGVCHVLLVPRHCSLAAKEGHASSGSGPALLAAQDLLLCSVRQPRSFDVVTGQLSQDNVPITAMDWSPHEELQLVGGLADGSVLLWKLSSESWGVVVSEARGVYMDTTHVVRLQDSPCVTSVKYCPFNADLFLVGHFDGHVRVWDVRDEEKAACDFASTHGPIASLAWDPSGQGFYSGTSAEANVFFTYLWSAAPIENRNMAQHYKRLVYSHGHPHGAVWALGTFHQQGIPGVVSVCSDGSVRIASAVTLLQPRRPVPMPAGELYRLQLVTHVDGGTSEDAGDENERKTNLSVGGAQRSGKWLSLGAVTSTRRVTKSTEAFPRMTDPRLSLRALSVTAVEGLGVGGTAPASISAVVVAYGGVTGLVRVQRLC